MQIETHQRFIIVLFHDVRIDSLRFKTGFGIFSTGFFFISFKKNRIRKFFRQRKIVFLHGSRAFESVKNRIFENRRARFAGSRFFNHPAGFEFPDFGSSGFLRSELLRNDKKVDRTGITLFLNDFGFDPFVRQRCRQRFGKIFVQKSPETNSCLGKPGKRTKKNNRRKYFSEWHSKPHNTPIVDALILFVNLFF